MADEFDRTSPDGEASDDAFAVVGMSCRLPQAPDPAAFWHLLRTGTSAIVETPADRWTATGGPPAGPDTGVGFGGFLDDVDRFDPEFFGISPREAVAMDPQQRLILELAWEAFEDAAIIPATLKGSATGVFIGAIRDDYANLLARRGADAFTRHTLTGTQRGIVANRVSYRYGLTGPSLTIDTAQSSSLVAVHLAVESLRRGESTLALAGGVNLNLAVESAVQAARFGGLSPDGRCRTFDARANGYVRGEGGGIVVVKPLSRALADGDRISCVIRGSAVNNDGATDGLTVPSRDRQAEVIRRACARAGVDPAEVQYVELHGTGTKVGDPVEAAALGAALGAGQDPGSPLRVGSVKTNVGHLEAAAGITGLLKAVLSIRHRRLPPSLHYETPPADIDLATLGLQVQSRLGPWPGEGRRPLLAGVSSFGVGGTNCHVIVGEPPAGKPRTAGNPPPPATAAAGVPAGVLPWVLSGKTPAALAEAARRLHAHLTDRPDLPARDVGFSLATTRTHHDHRAAAVGATREDLLAVAESIDTPAGRCERSEIISLIYRQRLI